MRIHKVIINSEAHKGCAAQSPVNLILACSLFSILVNFVLFMQLTLINYRKTANLHRAENQIVN